MRLPEHENPKTLTKYYLFSGKNVQIKEELMAEVVPRVLVCVAFLPLVAVQQVQKIALILRPLTSIRELVGPKFANVQVMS